MDQFFAQITQFKSLTHLTIKIFWFEPIHQSQLIALIKGGSIKIISLVIQVKIISEPNVFIGNLYFKSSLERLKIAAGQYTELQAPSTLFKDGRAVQELPRYNNSKMKNEVNKQCCDIIELNRMLKTFLSQEIPRLKEQIEKLQLLESTTIRGWNQQQIAFAIGIGNEHNTFNRLEKFYGKLIEDDTFKKIKTLAYEWNLEIIISRDDVEKFKLVVDSCSTFDINHQFHFSDGGTERLIDRAVRSNPPAVNIIEFLISSGANLECAFQSSGIPDRPIPRLHVDWPTNFPFLRIMRDDNIALKKLFLEIKGVLYDGLAWIIYKNDDFSREIIQQIKIASLDMNATIPCGLFFGFTLFQLMVFYQRTELLLEYLKNRTTEAELIELASQLYPRSKDFKYSEWSVWAVIIYTGQYDVLTAFFEKANLDRINLRSDRPDNTAVQLLLRGAALRFEDEGSILANYKKCLSLLKRKSPKIVTENLSLYDDINQSELPLLYFVIRNRIFFLIEDDIQDIESNGLTTKIIIKTALEESSVEVNPLEFAILMGVNPEVIEFLFKLYERRGLLDTVKLPLLPLSCFCGVNLFQYSVSVSVMSKRFNYNTAVSLFKQFVEWDGCKGLINSFFPRSHPIYPGWLPIHVIILLALTGQIVRLDTLLQSAVFQYLDITIPFPEQGIPHSLTGYYPTSALFFPQNPLKNNPSSSSCPSLFGNFKKFLQLINELSKKFSTSRQKILDQALFFALIYHPNGRIDVYDEFITILIEQGANPYQSYGTEGNLIIDIARNKGLLYSFPQHVDDEQVSQYSVKQVYSSSQLTDILVLGNRRVSELQCFSDEPLKVSEGNRSIVALLRNKKSKVPEHVFIVIERIIQGRSVMDFVDFVQDLTKPGKGKVRHEQIEGRITDSLLSKCELQMMRKINVDDLICLHPWPLSLTACDNLLKTIALDEDRQKTEGNELDYVVVGNRSVFARLFIRSRMEKHNCYTWAREKLVASQEQRVEQDLKPTIGEWLATISSLKDSPWYKNRYVRLCACASASILVTVGFFSAGLAMYVSSKEANYSVSFGSVLKP